MFAIDRLREAIIADVREDTSTIGDLDDVHRDLVDAFNEYVRNAGLSDARLITDSDLVMK